MAKPRLFVGVGTEVVVQVLLPTCRAVIEKNKGEWPDELFVLMADSDRRAQNRFKEAELPSDRVTYVQLSIEQVKEAMVKRKDEFRDLVRPELRGLIKDSPDNGACMVPLLGRLMLRSARPSIVRQLNTIARHLSSCEESTPDIFVVLNPLSGTSRGSVFDLPLYLRHVFPGAMINALLIYPAEIERIDTHSSTIYETNFIEAMRILEYMASPRDFEVFADPKRGWEQHNAELIINNVIAFDARYGNLRLLEFAPSELRLEGGLPELCEQVERLLVGIALRDPLADWFLGRLSDVTLHRSRAEVAGRRTCCHSLHEVRIAFDRIAFRKALVERALHRVLAPLSAATKTESGDAFLA
ncbi:MAG: tubulin-like doman-containing protein [Myxococcota bacterium]|jgi:hypothetical protein|nr:tubulin-like doman-containing protein [Myxococcota bacterium]